ncbi:hypothetical protein O6H91_23G032200 [Diphasiastrum complanatum]|uniref:Uncharacterized protein n=1 Tax=Diphasiastrum complanatum TaxID=34168 RepID=A0ACC2A9E8_DIPCM|nr:hypothetical protein O6H91_23G032200 [Diphasiastrum complanatum]
MMEKLKTKLCLSTAFHPETDGQTERVNQWLECYLRHFVCDQQTKWIDWLHLAEFSYNSTPHMSIGMTSFYALYGCEPTTPIDMELADVTMAAVPDELQNMQNILKANQDHMQEAQQKMKYYADKLRSFRGFHEGDYVYLRLQPYRQSVLKKTKSEKLSPRFYGPYQILKRVGELAYELDLPSITKMHNVFHVSLLKKHIGKNVQTVVELPPINEEGNLEVEPEAVVGYRDKELRNGKRIQQYLIKWKGLPPEDNTWEDHSYLKRWPTILETARGLMEHDT